MAGSSQGNADSRLMMLSWEVKDTGRRKPGSRTDGVRWISS